jgi:imidazolonepropionase-like amidohydrolase
MVKERQATAGNWMAFVGGTLISGTGQDPLPEAVVVIGEKVIQEVGRRDEVQIPADCEIIDVSGKTIMPGMFDCHCHVSLTTMSIEKRLFTPKTVEIFQTAEIMKRTLHAGFTTIREPGVLNDVGFRQAVEMGLIEGPRLVLAGGIGQTGGHFDEYYPRDVELPLFGVEMCNGVPDVQKAARRVLRQGFDFIKVCATGGVASPADSPEYTEWTLEELKAIVYEASARGKAVMAHAEGTQGIKNAIRAGVWTVEHGSMVDDEAIQMFLDTGTYLVPTLFTMEELVERGEEMGLTPVSLAKVEKIKHTHAASFRRAAEAGVKIAVGTDAIDDQMHGKNARELELMVRYGFTPMQAIVAATKTSAEACRVDDKVGTLEPGKLADLLIVDGNPLDDIAILQDQSRLMLVMKEGRGYVNRL